MVYLHPYYNYKHRLTLSHGGFKPEDDIKFTRGYQTFAVQIIILMVKHQSYLQRYLVDTLSIYDSSYFSVYIIITSSTYYGVRKTW